MPAFEVRLGHAAVPPAHLLVRRLRDDERVQYDIRISEPLLELFDRLVEPDLGIVWSFQVPESLGIHECHVLLAAIEQPENEVGVEVARFKEADPSAAALIAQQVQLFAGEEAPVGLILDYSPERSA